MPSFDIVSEVDMHEVGNAVDQANREVGNRFDFKGIEATYQVSDNKIMLKAESDFQLKQMMDILQAKLVKRGIDVGHLKPQDPVIQMKTAEQAVDLQQGVSSDAARKIIKLIKNEKMKVQTAIQGEQVRVTGKKRDDLQQVIALLKDQDLGLPLQFDNFRD